MHVSSGADNPCIGVFCDRGLECKVDDQTGEAFCEPSCELDNGGCRDDQICELQTVQCVRAPCPPVVKCTDIISKSCDLILLLSASHSNHMQKLHILDNFHRK